MIGFMYSVAAGSAEWLPAHKPIREAFVAERVEIRPSRIALEVALVNKPEGSAAELARDIPGGASLCPDVPGRYELTIAARDGIPSRAGQMRVTIFACEAEVIDHVPARYHSTERLRQVLRSALPALVNSRGGFDGTKATLNGVSWQTFNGDACARTRAEERKHREGL